MIEGMKGYHRRTVLGENSEADLGNTIAAVSVR